MSVNRKLKVVWICHFSNTEIQFRLSIGKPVNEFAPWIPNTIKGFEDKSDVELHVIAPHEYLKNYSHFFMRNIHYHFIPIGIPYFHRHWPGFFRYDILTNFKPFRQYVRFIIEKIKPDIINLIGAENAYYSSSILDYFREYPCLITIQGFISQLKHDIPLNIDVKRKIMIEEKILRTCRNFCGEQDSLTYISRYNSDINFFKFYFPINANYATNIPDLKIKYDCIYFGQLSKIKGTEDFIKVISELKIKLPEIKACIVGPGDPKPFFRIAEAHNVINNIQFVGFVESQKILFEFVKSSSIFLAPPHKERVSSTIREAMSLKIPIIAYATGGIPYINEFSENILLVETGDYQGMAQKALILLQNDQLRKKISERAYKYCVNEYGLNRNCERLISAYETILMDYKT